LTGSAMVRSGVVTSSPLSSIMAESGDRATKPPRRETIALRPVRTAASFAALMLASAVVAPSVGAFEELSETGTVGDPITMNDTNGLPGVKCKYENNAGKNKDELDKIRISGHWAHGPYDQKTWVGSRFKIFKDAKPFDGNFKQIKASKIVKKKGNQTQIANFDARTWTAPENTKARYQVRQILSFYKKGSKKKVIGKFTGVYEVYKHQLPGPAVAYTIGDEGGTNGFCQHKFWAPAP
jgi:hypothetical protein